MTTIEVQNLMALVEREAPWFRQTPIDQNGIGWQLCIEPPTRAYVVYLTTPQSWESFKEAMQRAVIER